MKKTIRPSIFMKVTSDKYELPLIVADTCKELAQLDATTETNIYSALWHREHKQGRSKYVRIYLDQMEYEE